MTQVSLFVVYFCTDEFFAYFQFCVLFVFFNLDKKMDPYQIIIERLDSSTKLIYQNNGE